jgi:hypothetical protein
MIPKRHQAAVTRKVLAQSPGISESNTPKLDQVSLFYRFYLARALEHAGMADYYCDLLEPWRNMLALGLTTTPEYSDPSRSDTHAWSAHPAYDFANDHCWHPAWIAGLRYCASRTESRKVAMGRSLDATSQGNDCGPLRQEYDHHRGIHNSAGFSVRNARLERPLLPTPSGRAEIPVAVANSHSTLQLCRTTSAL